MKKISRNRIHKFGEASVSEVFHIGNTYAVIDNDGTILCVGKELKGYIGDFLRTMYTGDKYGTGDYILVSDRHGEVCKFV